MTTLFLNTAYYRTIVSLIRDNQILFFTDALSDKNLSSNIMPLIDRAFKETKFKINDIDQVMVVNGPGSFTGIRIGVTIAKVICFSLSKKLIPISTLELLATTPFVGDVIIPLIDARRDYVYAGVYSHTLNVIDRDRYIKIADLMNNLNPLKSFVLISGDEFSNIDTIKPKIDILKIVNKHLYDEGVNAHTLKPNYLKRTEAEENMLKLNDKIN